MWIFRNNNPTPAKVLSRRQILEVQGEVALRQGYSSFNLIESEVTRSLSFRDFICFSTETIFEGDQLLKKNGINYASLFFLENPTSSIRATRPISEFA